jgi:predicted GNAT family N-acyltransferase
MVVSLQLADLEPLDRSKHDRTVFTCGNPVYDKFLREKAAKEQDQKISVCFVLTAKNSNEIIGYYTLSSTSIVLPTLPEKMRKKLPKYPDVPATLIGRLAASNKPRYEHERLGEHLLMDALKRAWLNAKTVASWAVVLDSEEKSKGFYERYEFQSLPDQSLRLYITMADIEQLFVLHS